MGKGLSNLTHIYLYTRCLKANFIAHYSTIFNRNLVSDDLLNEISQLNYKVASLTFLRKLPVDVNLAKDYAIAKINEIQPNSVICCGMAERRTKLSIESNATYENTVLKTLVNLPHLIDDSNFIEISHDAGKFVCEGFYYSILNYISERNLNINCIFVHVPILTKNNLSVILADFQKLIYKIKILSL